MWKPIIAEQVGIDEKNVEVECVDVLVERRRLEEQKNAAALNVTVHPDTIELTDKIVEKVNNNEFTFLKALAADPRINQEVQFL